MSYRRTQLREVFRKIIRNRGYNPDSVTMSAVDRAKVADLLNWAVETAWEQEFWPEVMLIEQRRYRRDWDVAETYEIGEEVFFVRDDGAKRVYRCLTAANLGNDPEDTEDTNWLDVSLGFVTSVDLRQDWERNEIGYLDVQAHCFASDPRLSVDTPPVEDVYLDGGQLIFRGARSPAEPWIKFRPPAPQFSWTDWDEAEPYAIGDRVYLDLFEGERVGEAFVALRPNTGANPFSSPEDWLEVPFPHFLRDFVVAMVSAEEKEEDEARYRGRALAERILEDLSSKIIEQQGTRQRAVFHAR